MSEIGSFLLSSYLVQLPVLLIWLVGIVIAAVRWRRHPRVSLLLCLALVLLGARALIVPVIRYRVQISDLPVGQMGYRFGVLNVVSAVVGAVAWILVLVAAFRERDNHDASGA